MFILFPKFRMRISVFALPSAILMLWLEGAMPFFILMLSAAVHELGHIAAIYFCGYRIRRFDILPMGALLVCPEGIPYNREMIIALCGPLASLLLGAFSLMLYSIFGGTQFVFAAVVNIVLAFFNLMPFKKLDGGKALYCFLMSKHKKTAERVCSAVSAITYVFFFSLLGFFAAKSGFNLGVLLLSLTLAFQLLCKENHG